MRFGFVGIFFIIGKSYDAHVRFIIFYLIKISGLRMSILCNCYVKSISYLKFLQVDSNPSTLWSLVIFEFFNSISSFALQRPNLNTSMQARSEKF